MTVVCLVLGGMLGVQVHTQQLRGATQVGRQTSALVGMLTRNEAQVEQQQEEIERLRGVLSEYEREAASEKGLTRLMQEELHTTRIALGTVAVKGPGVELELSDSTMRAGGGFGDQDVYVIHDFDLLQVANELWCAGAEAVSINGQRLLAGSPIACSARLIEVNKVTVASPFKFKAIGDRDKLMSALNIRDGVLDRLRVLQFPVKLMPKEEVVIPPISVPPKYEHAQPVGKEAKQ
ncbi:MAG TPA: DUF881 domain-containing protein [Armatimonadota bacterium]|nr:DUF881 domain-containing protein [Armatimonadota bacterium]